MPDQPQKPVVQLLKGHSDAIVKENARRLIKSGRPVRDALALALNLAGYRPPDPSEEPNSQDSPGSTKPSTAVH